jgi:hypothetical protein
MCFQDYLSSVIRLVVAVDADVSLAEGEEAAAVVVVLEEDVADPPDPDRCELSRDVPDPTGLDQCELSHR